MTTPWVTNVPLIANGDDVKAETPNASLEALAQRTQYLYERIQAYALGEAIYIHEATLDASVEPLMPVYLDKTSGTYKPALAAVDNDVSGNYAKLADSGYVVGIVISKQNDTLGDILVHGKSAIDETELAARLPLGATLVPGHLWLSSADAGGLTYQEPPVSLYVMEYFGDEVAFVRPDPRNVMEDHIHYEFQLTAKPAGQAVCTGPGGTHSIVNPDPDLPGWLPADHSSFQGLAPAGAKFGYNLSQDQRLSEVFPPIPISSTYIEIDGVGLQQGRHGYVIIDLHGIWWMQDCYGNAPWPTNYPCVTELSSSSSSTASEGSSSSSSESSSSSGFEEPCGKVLWRTVLYYTRMTVKTDSAMVTSLTGVDPVRILDAYGQPATTGNLFASINFAFDSGVMNDDGVLAFKGVNGTDPTKLDKGPVVTRLKTSGGDLEITSENGDAADGFYGVCTIRSLLSERDLEGPMQLLNLNNVRDDTYQGVWMLTFLNNRLASLRGKVTVPLVGLPTNPEMHIRFWFLARTAGTLPDFTAGYRRIPRPGTCVDPEALPTVDTALSNLALSGCGALAADEYIEYASDSFSIEAGDLIFVDIERDGRADAYPGAVGMLIMNYVIEGA